MEFSLSKKAACLTGGVVLLILLLLTMLPVGSFWLRIVIALGVSALVWLYFYLQAVVARWGVKNDAYYCSTGLLFTVQRHIALSEITAIKTIQGPLQHPLHVCTLLVYSAGSVSLLVHVRSEDARTLLLLWGG